MKKQYLISLLTTLIVILSSSAKLWSQGLEGIYVERYYITDAADEADAISQGAISPLPVGSVAYRVYVDMADGYKFSQLYGNGEHNLVVNTTTSFFNDPNYGVAVNPAAISVNNSKKHTALIDSWFTTGGAAATKVGVIESEDTDGSIGNNHNVLGNNPGGCYGLPINGTNAQDGLAPSTTGTYVVPNTLGLGTALDVLDQTDGNSIVISNGSIAALGGVVGPTSSNRVLVAQFTTNGVLSFQFNVQLVQIGTNAAENYVSSNPGTGELTHPSLTFISGLAPTVAITSPTQNQTLPFGSAFTLSANANDNGGVITNVEFYVDGMLLGGDDSFPYEFSYTGTGGAHTVYSIAYDNDCQSTQSATVNFNIVNNNPPVISISGPTSVIYPNTVVYNALASDSDGTIASVEIFIDGVSQGVDTNAPYNFTLNPELGLGQQVYGVATDNLGSQTTSNIILLDVVANQVPQVTITSPLEQTGYIAPNIIAVTADATDSDGSVVSVEFFVNGASIGIDTNEPFGIDWISEPGIISFYALATDNMGAQTNSETVQIIVIDPNALTYELSNEFIECNSATSCVSLSVTETLPIQNVLGLDITLNYDPSKVIPTGNYFVSNDLTSSNGIDVLLNDDQSGTLSLTISLNGMGETSLNGSGDILCIEFQILEGFAPQETAMIDFLSINESYISGVETTVGTSGSINTTIDFDYLGNLKFWNNETPLYSSSDILNIEIMTGSNGAINTEASLVSPNPQGEFTTDFSFGNQINIESNILENLSVQNQVNGADILLAKTVFTQGNFVPTVYQIMAMDVNLDGIISAGDISQMKMRTTLEIPEYMQAWNYDNEGNSNGEPSLDWVFIPRNDANNELEYQISASFPNDDASGYSIFNVPVANQFLNLNIENYTPDFSICPIALSEDFMGIMLGDVDGNALLQQQTTLSEVVLDGASAIYTNIAGVNYLDIPVNVASTESFNSIDLWFEFNQNKFSFEEVASVQNGWDVYYYFNENDNMLRITASMETMDMSAQSVTALFNIRLALVDECALFQQEDITGLNTLVNGQFSVNSISQSAIQPISTLGQTLCSATDLDFAFNSDALYQEATSFIWNFGNGDSSIDEFPITSFDSEGTFTIQLMVTSSAGCVFNFEQEINILPAPQVSFSSILDIENLTVNFTNNSFVTNGQVQSYEWSFGDASTSGELNPVHIYTSEDIYEVVLGVYSEDGCYASSSQMIELITGVEELINDISVLVYPNPCAEYLIIEADVNGTCEIIDSQGRIVSPVFSIYKNSKINVNMSILASGIYYIKFYSKEYKSTVAVMRK